MSELHPRLAEIIDRIERRSHATRVAYLDQIDEMHSDGDSDRRNVSCSNMAHVAAAAGEDKADILAQSDLSLIHI